MGPVEDEKREGPCYMVDTDAAYHPETESQVLEMRRQIASRGLMPFKMRERLFAEAWRLNKQGYFRDPEEK